MPDPRLFLNAPLAAGARVALEDAQAHKIVSVLRLGLGAGVRVFNARDGEWRAHLVEAGKRGAAVAVAEKLRDAAAPAPIDLLFAPLKRDATDLVVEKATELGARALRPVITARTITDTVRLDRLALIARAAAEQTERCDAPEIAAPIGLAAVLGAWPAEQALLFADEAGDAPGEPWGGQVGRARAILAALENVRLGAGLGVLVGPEGGFTPQERAALRDAPFVIPVSLGPRILRAETAAIALLAIVQAKLGDWAAPLPERIGSPK